MAEKRTIFCWKQVNFGEKKWTPIHPPQNIGEKNAVFDLLIFSPVWSPIFPLAGPYALKAVLKGRSLTEKKFIPYRPLWFPIILFLVILSWLHRYEPIQAWGTRWPEQLSGFTQKVSTLWWTKYMQLNYIFIKSSFGFFYVNYFWRQKMLSEKWPFKKVACTRWWLLHNLAKATTAKVG